MTLAAAQYVIETKIIGTILKQIGPVITRKTKLQRQSWTGTIVDIHCPLCACQCGFTGSNSAPDLTR